MIWQVFSIDYGMKDKNPMDNVYFYRKTDLTKAIQIPKRQVHIKCHFWKNSTTPYTNICWVTFTKLLLLKEQVKSLL